MDRFVRGFIIGVVTSMVKDGLNWFSYSVLHYTKSTYAHFMAAFILGRAVRTNADLVLGQIIEFSFEGIIGVMFIYYAYRTHNKKNLWFKGFIFSNTVYFLTYNIGTFFRIPYQINVPIENAISNLIGSSIFGVLMGLAVYWWGKSAGDFQGNKI